jgi:hypothetical protein
MTQSVPAHGSAPLDQIVYACRLLAIGAHLCLLLTLCFLINEQSAFAQKHSGPIRNLPSAEKIVDNYLKAVGGKKTVGAIKDASYEWMVQLQEQTIGTASTKRKAPSSERFEMTFGNGQIISGTSSSSAWEIGLDNQLQTLTGAEGSVTKLRALLDASRLVNYKKLNVLARVVSVADDPGNESAYVVEFSTRGGARLQYSFNVQTSLITKVTDNVKKTTTSFEDYRSEKGVLEPHLLRVNTGGSGGLTLVLQTVNYDVSLDDHIFDPPAAETLDVAALLREVGKNQEEIEKRVTEYAFTKKETDREINNKGELKKETIKVYEVFPLAHREPIEKLIGENGIPLTGDRAAKEEKRFQEELLKAERDQDKDQREAARRRTEREKKNRAAGREGNDDPEISQFLQTCEFVSPRHERFSNRDVIVFDFRPRPGFRPGTREESLIAKLIGTVWIDPVDEQVIRLEARLAEGFKMAGGILLSLKPGAALVMEQTRIAEGLWLPQFAQINLSLKVLLFGGGDFNKTIEWSDYKHFSGDVKDYKLDAPNSVEANKKP